MSTLCIAHQEVEDDWDSDDLERDLGIALSEEQQMKEETNNISNADVILKLGTMCGDPHIPPATSDGMNGLLCRIAATGAAYVADEDDVAYLKDMIRETIVLLQQALSTEHPECRLTITHMGMLRTAYTSLCTQSTCTADHSANPSEVVQGPHEYSRSTREGMRGTLTDILRAESILPVHREQYATAEAQADYFDEGVRALERLLDRDSKELVSFIGKASEHLMCFLNSLVVPWLNDGNRLCTANVMASSMFGIRSRGGARKQAAEAVLNSGQSTTSLVRVLHGFAMLMTMAMQQINKRRSAITKEQQEKMRGGDAEGYNECRKQFVALTERFNRAIALMTEMRDALAPKTGTDKCDTPGGIMLSTGAVAEWFETAMADVTNFQILIDAVTAPVLKLRHSSDAVHAQWKQYTEEYGQARVCLWGAVEFLSLARVRVHQSGMPVFTGLFVVLASVLGDLMNADLGGPFVLCKDALRMVYWIFNDRKLLPTFDTHVPSGRLGPYLEKQRLAGSKHFRDGSPCTETKIIRQLRALGEVRTQNEKSQLVESRLSASLFMFAVKEALMRDAPEGCPTAPSERNKNLRRMYIMSLQILPSEKHFSSRRADRSSYLVERTRGAQVGQTAKEKYDKPWRDINGGVLLGTLYYPLAGEAMLATCDSINWHDPTMRVGALTTDKCVNSFLDRLQSLGMSWFNPENIIPTADRGVQGCERACAIFAQQRDLVHATCHCLRRMGGLWEYLQLTFSRHPTGSSGGGGGCNAVAGTTGADASRAEERAAVPCCSGEAHTNSPSLEYSGAQAPLSPPRSPSLDY
tara:strand:+ start:2432 stop:4858 length:2427 start_codon:yes stop_codon:yes gene_type:complete